MKLAPIRSHQIRAQKLRKLREEIKRRTLAAQRTRAREESARREVNGLKAVLKSHVPQFMIEDCAYRIMRDLVRKANEVISVNVRTIEDFSGDAVVTLEIPQLRMNFRVARLDMDRAFDYPCMTAQREVKHITLRVE